MKKEEINWHEIILPKEHSQSVLSLEQEYLIYKEGKVIGKLTSPQPWHAPANWREHLMSNDDELDSVEDEKDKELLSFLMNKQLK